MGSRVSLRVLELLGSSSLSNHPSLVTKRCTKSQGHPHFKWVQPVGKAMDLSAPGFEMHPHPTLPKLNRHGTLETLDILQLLPTKGCTHFTTIFTSPIIQPCRYHDLPFQTVSTPHEILGCRSADRLGGVATRENLTRKTKVMALSTSEFMALQAEFNNFVIISNPLKLRNKAFKLWDSRPLQPIPPGFTWDSPRRHWLGILHFAGRLGRRRNGAG